MKILLNNDQTVTIVANHTKMDFLDIHMDLEEGTCGPFNKPNNIPRYVNAKSNHPPATIKNIPLGIPKRLSNISPSEEIFKKKTMKNIY